MLQRSPSPDAIRARSSRARLKVGVRTYRVRAHTRRLVAAMRKANPNLGDDDLDQKAIARWYRPVTRYRLITIESPHASTRSAGTEPYRA